MQTQTNPTDTLAHLQTTTDKKMAEAREVLGYLREVTVTSAREADAAAEQVKHLKREIKELETARKSFTDPLSAVIKKINAKFNPVIEVYESAETIIKNAILAYKRAEEQKSIEAYRAAEALAQNNDLAGAQLHLALAAQPTSVQAGVSTRVTWSARVVDVTQIPREYLVPDIQALNALARATKGKSTIPGVEFVATESLAVRQ